VTGDRIMQSAANMLTIARVHGRFLGPVDWTPSIRAVVTGCPEKDFQTLPTSTARAGHEVKATGRRLRFKVKEKLSDDERKQLAQRRRQLGVRGRVPTYRPVHFWMRAAVILDTARQKADAERRLRRMRNLKTDLPIRPIFLHRDDTIVALCFISVLALTLYTLIERNCQANTKLTAASLRTTTKLLDVLSTFLPFRLPHPFRLPGLLAEDPL
ncbi:MAG: hypothetical protein ACE5GO_06965, partial [Anaerolineales bacterium]